MSGGVKRAQGRKFETHLNTRQDRNAFITEGGTWSWNAGVLSWDQTVWIRRGAIAADTIAPDNIPGLIGQGYVVYVDVDRDTGGNMLTALLHTDLENPIHDTDERVVIGVRGWDGKFYMRDGTIFSDGDSKALGTLNSATDRTDTLALAATVTYSTVFSYLEGSNQLAVYVGGVLQELGVQYTEAGPPATFVTDIIFLAPHIPTEGERLTFLNIVGGQGPAGVTSMQEAYLISGIIALLGAVSPLHLWGAGNNAALAVGEDAVLANANFLLSTLGALSIRAGNQGVSLRDNLGVDDWRMVPELGTGNLLLYNEGSGQGIRLAKDGSGLSFGFRSGGSYPGLGFWTDVDPIRWNRITTTVPGAAGPVAGVGPLDIAAITVSSFDPITSRFVTWTASTGGNISKRLSVSYDAAGLIYLSAFPDGTGAPGADLVGATVELIVFYKG